jgi:hypothetical protein
MFVTVHKGTIYHTSPSALGCPTNALNFFTLNPGDRDVILRWKRNSHAHNNLHTVQHSLVSPARLLLLHPGFCHKDLARAYGIKYTRDNPVTSRDEVLIKFAHANPELDGALLVKEMPEDIIQELVLFGDRCLRLTRPHAYRLNTAL